MERKNIKKRTIIDYNNEKQTIINEDIIKSKKDINTSSLILFLIKNIIIVVILLFILVAQLKNYESVYINEEMYYKLKLKFLNYTWVEDKHTFDKVTNFTNFLDFVKGDFLDGIYIEQTEVNNFTKTYEIPTNFDPKVSENRNNLNNNNYTNDNYFVDYLNFFLKNCGNCEFKDSINSLLDRKSKLNLTLLNQYKYTNDCKGGDNNTVIIDNGEFLSRKYLDYFERPLFFNKILTTLHIQQTRRNIGTLPNRTSLEFWTDGQNITEINGLKYNSTLQAFQYDINIFENNKNDVINIIDNYKNMYVDKYTESLTVNIGFINANFNTISYVTLNVFLRKTNLFDKINNIETFPMYGYITMSDKTRIIFEIIYIIIFFIILITEIIFLYFNFKNIISIIEKSNPHNKETEKFKYNLFRIKYGLLKLLYKILFGTFKYIYNRFINFIIIIFNILGYYYWISYIYYGKRNYDFNFNIENILNTIQYYDIHYNIKHSIINLNKYRNIVSIVVFIYLMEFLSFIFSLNKNFKMLYNVIISSLKNNIFYLIFLLNISLAFGVFTHYYFGDSIGIFSDITKSFIIITSTILGFKKGMIEMVKIDPIVATVSIMIYYFIVIIILLNMFIIFVTGEYKAIELEEKEKEVKITKTKSKFSYKPFFWYSFLEEFKYLREIGIYKYINKEKYEKLIEIRKINAQNLKKNYIIYETIDFDEDFVSFKKIKFKNNELNLKTLQNNYNTKNNIFLEKEVNYIWKFLLYFILFVLQMVIIYTLYLPVGPKYKQFINNTNNLLIFYDKYQLLQSEMLSDYNLRYSFLDIISNLLNSKIDYAQKYKIDNIHLKSNNYKMITNFIIEITNNQIIENDKQSNLYKIIPYSFINNNNFIKSKVIYPNFPTYYSDFNFRYIKNINNNEIFNFCPALNYEITASGIIKTQFDSDITYVKPYILKLLLDKMIGPQTDRLSIIMLFENKNPNKILNEYNKLTISFQRKYGDFFDYQLDYEQIRKDYSSYIKLMIISVIILKIINLLLVAIKSLKKILNTNFEYNIWYKVNILNNLNDFLLYHRNRKKPEFFRKISKLLRYENVNTLLELILFLVFSIYLIFYIISLTKFNISLNNYNENGTNKNNFTYEIMNNFDNINSQIFNIFLINGIENFLHCISILFSLKKIRFFEYIIESFRNIFKKLFYIIFIMAAYLFTFSYIMYLLLGYKYIHFSNFLNIQNFTSILITFSDLELYTDNYNMFIIIIFIIPFFILLKFTILFIIISIIYSSVGKAKVTIKKRRKGLKEKLTITKFIKISIIIFKKKYTFSKTLTNNKLKTFRSLFNLTSQDEYFNKLVEKVPSIQKINNIDNWANNYGDLIAEEIMERNRINNILKVIQNTYIRNLIEYKENYFLKDSDDKDLKKYFDFFLVYLNYFRTGYLKLNALIENQNKEFEDLNLQMEEDNANNKILNKKKKLILDYEKKLEELLIDISDKNKILNEINKNTFD